MENKTAEQLAKEICLKEENTGKHLLDVMAIGMHEYASLQTSEFIEAVEKVRDDVRLKGDDDFWYVSRDSVCEKLDQLLKAHKPTPQ